MLIDLELPAGLSISPVFNISDLYAYYGDDDGDSLKLEDLTAVPATSHQEIIDVLDVHSTTTCRGTYTLSGSLEGKSTLLRCMGFSSRAQEA